MGKRLRTGISRALGCSLLLHLFLGYTRFGIGVLNALALDHFPTSRFINLTRMTGGMAGRDTCSSTVKWGKGCPATLPVRFQRIPCCDLLGAAVPI